MTEYDKESGDAFGLVLGIEPEWCYFNLNLFSYPSLSISLR